MTSSQADIQYLMRADDLQGKKKFLAEKLTELQKKVAMQTHALEKQKLDTISENKEFVLDLLDVLDGFDIFFENIKEKEEEFDKPVKMMVKNVSSIQKKLVRVLRGRDIVPMEFPDGKAQMGKCKVVDTVEDPDKENGEINSVLKKGYISRTTGAIIRMAEVITVKHVV